MTSAYPFGLRDKLWQRLVVAETGLLPQPAFRVFDPSADLADTPGAYILKPRFGSNGFGVVRVVSRDSRLTVESDCPDTARYLDDFPADPALAGRDVVAAVAANRSRYADRARVGMAEWMLDQSVLEDEIRPDRADGSLFEPRVIVQRTTSGFVTLGAICKRIDTPVGACVARDFREEPLDVSLSRFLGERVPTAQLADRVSRTATDILTAADRVREALTPRIEARGRVHQFGVDGRMVWDVTSGRAGWVFLEFQFGIGRIELPVPGYRTRADLAAEFGPEVG